VDFLQKGEFLGESGGKGDAKAPPPFAPLARHSPLGIGDAALQRVFFKIQTILQ